VKENGKTAVFITHSISAALEIGDRIVVLKRPAKIAYDVSFDADTGREERELIRGRIGELLAVRGSIRHCEEPTGHANARPMTGSATKQSSFLCAARWIASLRSQWRI
jgi:ABC-type sugar transport system ATPase subunit